LLGSERHHVLKPLLRHLDLKRKLKDVLLDSVYFCPTVNRCGDWRQEVDQTIWENPLFSFAVHRVALEFVLEDSRSGGRKETPLLLSLPSRVHSQADGMCAQPIYFDVDGVASAGNSWTPGTKSFQQFFQLVYFYAKLTLCFYKVFSPGN